MNAKCSEKFTQEQQMLQPLPKYRYPDYEVLSAKVSPKFHAYSCTPHKRSRRRSRSKQERQLNRQLAQVRMTIEHILRKLKVFRILSERYRNRRKRFGRRFNLTAGLLNYELAPSK